MSAPISMQELLQTLASLAGTTGSPAWAATAANALLRGHNLIERRQLVLAVIRKQLDYESRTGEVTPR